MKIYFGNSQKCDAIHLIERGLGVARAAAAAEIGIQSNVFHDFNSDPTAESLKEILVQQSGAQKLRIERGNIAEIGVVCAKFDSGEGLYPDGQKTPADSGARSNRSRICAGLVGLQRMKDRKGALVGNGIFEKGKRPIILVSGLRSPCCRRRGIWNGFKALPEAGRAGIVDGVVITAFGIEEAAPNMTVRAVVPRSRVGRRAAKNSGGNPVSHTCGKVSAVQRVETRGPGQIKASGPKHPTRVGIFIGQAQVISAIEQILQRLL